MRTLKLVVASGLMLAMASAFAQVVVPTPAQPTNVGGASPNAYTPGAGITGTPHDWSSTSGQTILIWLDSKGNQTTYNTGTAALDVNGADPTKQLAVKVQIGQCTKCHTPHQAKSVNLLWNHTLSAVTYKWDAPATTAGTVYPTFKGDTYKGSTTKCLSCHDGLLASTDGMWFNRQMMTGNKYVAPAGSLNSGHEVAIGANMSGSHPVATPYPLNGASNTYNSTANGANIASTEWVADPMATNKIRLFNDNGAGDITAGAVAGKSGIECASCHDVHNGSRSKDIRLLTGKINGSDRSPGGYICTQCHLK